MLAAEYRTLPRPMQDAVIRFFDDNEAWLAKVLVQGRDEGSLRFTGSPNEAARMIVSVLEGAMLVSRPYGDIDRFEAAAGGVLASLAAPVTKRPRNRQA
jgi:TetR/AcrR family transcriptional repressor of nem operon